MRKLFDASVRTAKVYSQVDKEGFKDHRAVQKETVMRNNWPTHCSSLFKVTVSIHCIWLPAAKLKWVKTELFLLQSHLPFAVVGSNDEVKIGNKMVKARQYPWGTVQGTYTLNPIWQQIRKLERTWFLLFELRMQSKVKIFRDDDIA